MLSHDYEYGSILETSVRVNWKLEDVIGRRTFDYSLPFLPEALAGVSAIRCLSDAEKLKLNQIRGFTYLAMFGLVEEYIVPSVLDHVRTGDRSDDHEVRALLHFAEEETKHIQLFKWFVREFERGFGTPCGVIGPASDIAAGILDHSPLGVFLTTLQIEWMTQKHYLESVKETKEGLDPLFRSLLKHHWMEESQHAKLDTSTTTWTSARCSTAGCRLRSSSTWRASRKPSAGGWRTRRRPRSERPNSRPTAGRFS